MPQLRFAKVSLPSLWDRFTRKEELLSACILLGAAYLLFANTFGNAWTMDDLPVIVNNPDVHSLSAFLHDNYPGRPLREITYLLDYKLFGLDPAGYHLQNIFWHALNCMLLLVLVIRISGNRWAAWTAALFFLVHPIHVEVVANISHRKDSLALAFILLSMLAYLNLFRDKARRLPWLVASLVLWGIALLAKQNAVALPLVICAFELACIPEGQRFIMRNDRVVRWSTVVAGSAVVAWFAHLAWNSRFLAEIARFMAKTGDSSNMDIHDYYAMIIKSAVFMLGKFVFPVDLSMEYTFPVPASLLDAWVMAGFFLLGLCATGVHFLKNRSRSALFALAWVLIFLIPSSNLFWPSAYFAADRYFYTPSAGLCILLGLGLTKVFESAPHIQVLVLVFLLSGMSILTWEQNRVWKSQFTLYNQILQTNPHSSAGLIGLGAAYQDRGELTEALACYEQARERFPDNALVYNHMGVVHMMNNDMGKASACFLKAITLNPDFAEAHSNLGLVYETMGEQDKALAALQQSLYINPGNNRAYTNLGMLYERMGCYDDAEKMHRRALEECGEYAEAHYNLGVSLCRSGKFVQAREEFCNAVRLAPDHPEALFNAALLALKLGDGVAAVSTLPHLQQLNAKLAGDLERELRERNLR